MNFLICFNEAYSRQWLTLMVSIIKNNPNAEIHFFILTDKLSESTSRKIMEFSRAKVVIEIYTVNIEEISTFRTGRHFNKYIFLRLLFPKIPQIANIDRLIYLDSDMICVGTLDALFSQKQNLEKTIGAVEEPYSDIIAIQK